MEVRFISAKEQRRGGNLPYHKEYCVEDLPFPRELRCPCLRTVIVNGRRYCVRCGEEVTLSDEEVMEQACGWGCYSSEE